MKKDLNINLQKLIPEDRRYLMNRSINILMANSSNKLANTSLFFSITSVCVAIDALIISIFGLKSEPTFWIIFITSSIIISVIIHVKRANKYINNEIESAKNGHNLMFKEHFKYAKKHNK